MIEAPWLNLAIAIGVGLMIGLERERSKGVGSARRPAGIRTFTLAALLEQSLLISAAFRCWRLRQPAWWRSPLFPTPRVTMTILA